MKFIIAFFLLLSMNVHSEVLLKTVNDKIILIPYLEGMYPTCESDVKAKEYLDKTFSRKNERKFLSCFYSLADQTTNNKFIIVITYSVKEDKPSYSKSDFAKYKKYVETVVKENAQQTYATVLSDLAKKDNYYKTNFEKLSQKTMIMQPLVDNDNVFALYSTDYPFFGKISNTETVFFITGIANVKGKYLPIYAVSTGPIKDKESLVKNLFEQWTQALVKVNEKEIPVAAKNLNGFNFENHDISTTRIDKISGCKKEQQKVIVSANDFLIKNNNICRKKDSAYCDIQGNWQTIREYLEKLYPAKKIASYSQRTSMSIKNGKTINEKEITACLVD